MDSCVSQGIALLCFFASVRELIASDPPPVTAPPHQARIPSLSDSDAMARRRKQRSPTICRTGQFDLCDGPQNGHSRGYCWQDFSNVDPNVEGGENVSFSLKPQLPVSS
jgi:hypothetical protein